MAVDLGRRFAIKALALVPALTARASQPASALAEKALSAVGYGTAVTGVGRSGNVGETSSDSSQSQPNKLSKLFLDPINNAIAIINGKKELISRRNSVLTLRPSIQCLRSASPVMKQLYEAHARINDDDEQDTLDKALRILYNKRSKRGRRNETSADEFDV